MISLLRRCIKEYQQSNATTEDIKKQAKLVLMNQYSVPYQCHHWVPQGQGWTHDKSPPNPLKPLSCVAASTQVYTWTFKRETPFENGIYIYPITLGFVGSEYIRLWWSISKTLGMVACFSLHLQEGDALWKRNLLIQGPWVLYGYGGLSPKP